METNEPSIEMSKVRPSEDPLKYKPAHETPEPQGHDLEPRRQWLFTGVPSEARLNRQFSKGVSRKINLAANSGINENPSHEMKSGRDALTISTLLAGFADFTTSHGVTHIHKSPGIVKRSIWMVLSLASAVFCGIHLWYLIVGYMSNAYSTQVTFADSRKLDFPAVTICNNNAIRRSALPSDIQILINNARTASRGGNRTAVTWPYIYQRISELFAGLNSTERFDLGQDLNSLIVYCSFDGSDCDMENDFWQFHDTTRGNCFTFNSNNVKGQATRSTTTAGSLYGLSLILNIDIGQYLSFLSEEAGARILVHNQKIMPFMSRKGVAVTPGHSNNIAIRREVLNRIGLPYNNCTTPVGSPVDNAYYEAFQANYSQWACLQTCYQTELVDSCGCYNTEIPYKDSVTTFENLTQTASRYCATDNTSDMGCESPITERFQDGTLPCSSCFPPCTETRFLYSKSTSIYPASSYIADFMATLEATHPTLAAYYNSTGDLESAVYENVLKVNIYYEDLEYTTFTEVASYEDFQFASDLGGTVGLWIGWSALTVFEFLQLFVDLMVYFGIRAASKKES